jgi:subtilase family serine protease
MPDAVPSGARGGLGPAATDVPRRVACGDPATRGPLRPATAPARSIAPASLAAALVLATAVLALWMATAASAAAPPAAGRTVRLAGSITPSLSALARRSGTAIAAGSRVHLTVALKPRDPAALAAYANAVSTPGSRLYGRYLSSRAFGRRFGASDAQLHAVRAAFTHQGLSLGRVATGRLSVPLVADAGTIEHGLDVQLRRVPGVDGRTVVAATRAPALAAGAAAGVQSIVGLQSSSAPRPLTERPQVDGPLTQPLAATVAQTTPAASTSAGPGVAGRTSGASASAGPRPCAKATATRNNLGGYTDDELAGGYGFKDLYAAGDEGKGTTIAIYELESNSRADIAAFESCYGIDTSISYVHVDGGAGHGVGTDEAAFDIENVIGFAPEAKILVYQGHNAQSGAPGAGPFDTFAAIVNQDRAQVVSVSWGGCEAQLGIANARAENTLFQQAAIQGQSIVAADGDNGAQDCQSPKHPNARGLAVDDPASQPWVTGVGGTTLQGLGPPLYETAWNSRHESAGAPSTAGATGGGVSALWAMPPSQSHAAKSLGVRSSAATGPHCGRRHGYCREVPDVSVDGDPTSGYVAYWNGDGTVAGARTGWQVLGGTSGSAPVWAALLALADSAPACHGRPIGFANPALYRAADDAYARDFHDVRLGNNDFATPHGFSAGRGYDAVTGLGTPNATALVASMCGDTITIDSVTAKQTPVGKQVSLAMRASDVHGARLRWSAKGLPPGLRINGRTGRITGKTWRAGRFKVRATVSDAQNATATARFTWTITKGAG